MTSSLGAFKDKRVLVTGATSGIGAACAELFAENGARLIITGRREERLARTSAELRERYGVEVTSLTFDLSDRKATEAALARHQAELKDLSILVNNAGLAKGTEPMPRGSFDDWDEMIDTNIKGLLYMTRLCLPHMQARGEGHVINIGSVAGRWTYPGGGVYCATKFAVRALSEGLRLDLQGTPIRVSNVEPGMVETEFSEVRFGGDKERAASVYKGVKPLSARDIAETVLWCAARPSHVNVQEVVIFPVDQAGVGPSYVNRKT